MQAPGRFLLPRRETRFDPPIHHAKFMRKLPARFEPLLFSLLLSGMMSLLVSAVATWHSLGMPPGFVGVWMASWLSSWPIAFPAVMVVAPVVRKLVARCVEPRA